MIDYRIDPSKLSEDEQQRLGAGNIATRLIRADFSGVEKVAASDFPAHVYQTLAPEIEAIEKLGFELSVVFREPNPTPDSESYCALFQESKNGTALSLVFLKRQGNATVYSSLSTHLQSGTELIDSNQKELLDRPPGQKLKSQPGASVGELWQAHQSRIQMQGTKPPLSDEMELMERVLLENRERINHSVRRGVLCVGEPPADTPPGAEYFWLRPANEAHLEAKAMDSLVPGFGLTKAAALMPKGMALVAGLIFLLCLKYAFDWYHLEHHAAPSQGVITNLTTHKSKNSTTYKVHYEYPVGKVLHHGEEQISYGAWGTMSRGKAIAIRYDEDSPSHSIVKGQESLFSYTPGLLPSTFIFLFMGAVGLLSHKQQKAQERLVAGGQVVEGVLIEASEQKGKHRHLVLAVELETPTGVLNAEYRPQSQLPVPEVGSKVRALYLDDKHHGLL